MTASDDTAKAFLEHLKRVEGDIATIKGDLGDLKADLMLLRVIIENAARLMADAMQEPRLTT